MAASSEVTLTAELGRETGSAAARRLRHEDKVPGVVYRAGRRRPDRHRRAP